MRAVRLQEFLPGSGFTDIEVESERLAMILAAKRGWALPTEDQLRQYSPRLEQFEIGRILVVSECTLEFAQPQLPDAIDGVPVVYRSWKQSCSSPRRVRPQPTPRSASSVSSARTYGPYWQTPEAFDDGAALFEAVCEREVEGIVAKCRDEPYRPGERGWVKIKNRSYWRYQLERESAINRRRQRIFV